MFFNVWVSGQQALNNTCVCVCVFSTAEGGAVAGVRCNLLLLFDVAVQSVYSAGASPYNIYSGLPGLLHSGTGNT